MNTRQAIHDIREIGDMLARAQHTTCFRPIPFAMTSLIAVTAAIYPSWVNQPMSVGENSFVRYWLSIACLNALIVGVDLGIRYWKTDSELQRGKTRLAIYQFAPCMLIGAYATYCLLSLEQNMAALLPGLWCIITSLGMFAALNNAPPAMVLPAAYYAVVGGMFWRFDAWTASLGSWSMGVAFGIGQAWIALLLWQGLRRG